MRLIKKADIDAYSMANELENVRSKLYDLKIDVRDFMSEKIDNVDEEDNQMVKQKLQTAYRHIEIAIQYLSSAADDL